MSPFHLPAAHINFKRRFDRDYLILAHFYSKTKSRYDDGIVSFQNINKGFLLYMSDSVDEKHKFRIKTNS